MRLAARAAAALAAATALCSLNLPQAAAWGDCPEPPRTCPATPTPPLSTAPATVPPVTTAPATRPPSSHPTATTSRPPSPHHPTPVHHHRDEAPGELAHTGDGVIWVLGGLAVLLVALGLFVAVIGRHRHDDEE